MTRTSKAQLLVQNPLMLFLKHQQTGENTIKIERQNALMKGTDKSEVGIEQGQGCLLRGHPITKITVAVLKTEASILELKTRPIDTQLLGWLVK